MVTTIYITRHGYRANWILDRPVPPPPTGIPADPVLAEHGLEQAEELSVHIAKAVQPRPQQILVSPYYRCLQTATPTARALDLSLCVEPGVTAPVKVLKEFFPLIDTKYTPIEPTTFVSETREELHARTARFIAGLIARLDAEQPEIDAVLLVTHAATKIALGRALLQDPERDIRTGTCSLDTYTRIPGSDKWNPVRIGETDFLSKGEEMHWGFENAYAPGSTEDIAARKLGSEPDAIPEMIKPDNAATTAATGDDEDEEVTVYVPLDLSQLSYGAEDASKQLSSQAKLQMVDLHSDRPMFRLGEALYEGSWQDMVGTELYSTFDGDVVAKTRTRIQLNPIGFEAKPETPETTGAGDEDSNAKIPAAPEVGTKRKQTLVEKLALITKRRLEEEKAKQAALAEREENLEKEDEEEDEEDEKFGGEEEDDENDEEEENDEDGDVVMKESTPETTST